MKKIRYAILLSSLMVPSTTALAVPEILQSMETKPYSLENTEEQEVEQENVEEKIDDFKENIAGENGVESNEYITWETIRRDLKIEDGDSKYEFIMKSEVDAAITSGEIAQLICIYIGRAPISLPQKDGGISGYVGRLVVEGIWGDLPTDTTLIIGNKEWSKLSEGIKGFMLNPTQYEKAFLDNLEKGKKTRIIEYKFKEKTLGELDDIALGEITLDNLTVTYEGQTVQLYKYLDEEYVCLKEASKLGLGVDKIDQETHIRKMDGTAQIVDKQVNAGGKVRFNKQDVYIGNIRTYSLTTGSNVFIPLEALAVYYDMKEENETKLLGDKMADADSYLNVNKNFITNKTEEVLQVQLINLYWNGNEILEEKWDINQMKPGEIYPNYNKVYTLNNSKLYLTTMISKVQIDNEIVWHTSEDYGQANKGILNHYTVQIQKREEAKKEEAKRQEEMKKQEMAELFPSSIIVGTIKYDVGPFKKGEQAEVYRADDGLYYYLHHAGKIVKVPWNSVKIPPNPRVETKQATIEELETYINNKGITSDTNFLVWTDLYRQKTYIFNREKGKWKVFRDKITKNDKVERVAILSCSTGNNTTPTPRGIYKLRAYVPYFGVNKGYRCKNAVQIVDDYLYHSLIFDKAGNYLLEGKGVLGQRASQGCIRFSPEESEWFYNTMPLRTTVWIN